jgi:hypothetical protein
MQNDMQVLAATVALLGGTAWAGDQVPGTLNFANETAGRIVQTQAEVASNEKEVEFGDFDNDDDLDVVIANALSDFGARKNKLYRNDAGVLNEVTAVLIPGFLSADVSRNAFFRDYNSDGFLDIYIINDGNTNGQGGTDKLYLSQHTDGVVTGFTQVNQATSPLSPECGGVSIDSDGDGDFDVYKGDYPNNNQDYLYLNNGSGSFTNSVGMVPTDGDYTVDVESADMNGDGRLDILISNWGANKLYLNNNNGAGSADGDYAYTGSVVTIADGSSNENAMEVGDLDGDGDNDIYWGDRSGAADWIYVNTGNNGSGVPQFSTFTTLPQSVQSRTSRKIEVADLNDDGRNDLVVYKEDGTNSRPTVLRNTSYNGTLSFVDWSPATAFPNSSTTHKAWHGAIFDTGNDGDLDIVLGGYNNDFLFEQVPTNEVNEADIVKGELTGAFNGDPITVLGGAPVGQFDTFTILGLSGTTQNPAFIATVLRGDGDYLLEVLSGETVIASSERGALGVEEALQATALAGDYTIRVTILDGDGGGTNPADFNDDGDVGAGDLGELLANWGKCPGCATDLSGDGNVGAEDLGELLANWGPVVGGGDVPYILEVLSRN